MEGTGALKNSLVIDCNGHGRAAFSIVMPEKTKQTQVRGREGQTREGFLRKGREFPGRLRVSTRLSLGRDLIFTGAAQRAWKHVAPGDRQDLASKQPFGP